MSTMRNLLTIALTISTGAANAFHVDVTSLVPSTDPMATPANNTTYTNSTNCIWDNSSDIKYTLTQFVLMRLRS